jgi:hypothetical protein
VTRYRQRGRTPDVDPAHLALLSDSPIPPEGNRWAVHTFRRAARTLWPVYRDAILASWIKVKPGTRPSCWWLLDAPEHEWRFHDLQRHPIPAKAQREFLARHGLLLRGERV